MDPMCSWSRIAGEESHSEDLLRRLVKTQCLQFCKFNILSSKQKI